MLIVTGGTGFIGSNLVRALCEREEEVIIVDWLGNGNKWKNIKDCKIADIVAPDKLPLNASIQCKAIFHLGAISSTVETDVDKIIENNFITSKNWFNTCKALHIPFIYASSAATNNGNPLNPYALSKHLFDEWVRKQQGHYVGLKFFNVYGPNEAHKGDQQSIISQALGKETFELFDVRAERDFVYVKDCVDVMLWFYEHPQIKGLFDVGTGAARSFEDVVMAVGVKNILYKPFPDHLKGKYQYHTHADLTALRNAGYTKDFLSLEQGVSHFLHDIS